MKPKITAVVQTYNAERHLDAVLKSLAVFDEIVIVDMESTDSTPEIARRHGARFIVVPKKSYTVCEAYRDFAVHQASHEWVLVVDADELIPPALARFLYAEIERDDSPRGYCIARKNYFMGRWMRSSYPDYVLRFFKKEGSYWPPTVHSKVSHQGPVVTIPAKRTDLAMLHLANENPRQMIAKMNLYTDDEIVRRSKSYAPWRVFVDPPFRFFKTYVLKGGFRDGMPGFIHAVHDAIYRFYILAKIQQQRADSKTNKDIDRDVENSSEQ